MLQYIPRNMHTVFALLCFVVVIHWLIFPYPSGLLHWHCGNLTIAPVPAKQPWWIWINTSCEFIMSDRITTTNQSTTKPCAYFLRYTVVTKKELKLRITGTFRGKYIGDRLPSQSASNRESVSMSCYVLRSGDYAICANPLFIGIYNKFAVVYDRPICSITPAELGFMLQNIHPIFKTPITIKAWFRISWWLYHQPIRSQVRSLFYI